MDAEISIHDNVVLSYTIDCEKQNITLRTFHERLSNSLRLALHVRPQSAVFMGGAAEMMSRKSRALPCGNIIGVEAGGGAASAEKSQWQGEQEKQGKCRRTEQGSAGHNRLYHGSSSSRAGLV